MERLIERLAGMREARTVVLLVTEGWRLFTIDQGLANQAGEFGPMIPQVGSVGGKLTMTGPPSGTNRSYAQERDCNTELVRLAGLENESRFREMFKRANRANVSFYPINPAGLRVFDSSLSEEIRPHLMEDGRRLTLRKDALLTLAENTDGLAVVDTNDLAAGMREIVDDVSAYYLLGYYSTNPSHDGRFRRIDVKAKPPGLKLRARRGYTAPDNKPTRRETFTPAPSGPEPPKGLDTALGELGRLRPSADVFTRGAIVGDRAEVVVEIASARVFCDTVERRRRRAGDCDAGRRRAASSRVRSHRGEHARGDVDRPARRGGGLGPHRHENLRRRRDARRTAELSRGLSGLTGDAVMYRGRPAATSPLRPVADLQYRRTERVHVEWALTGELDQRSARLLSRAGQPLAIPVAVTERETDGRKVVAADLNLAPLSAGRVRDRTDGGTRRRDGHPAGGLPRSAMSRVLRSSGSRVLGFSGPPILALVLLSGAIAQTSQQTPQQRPPVFRGESVLVTVDVYPQRDGKIVEGLKAEDFRSSKTASRRRSRTSSSCASSRACRSPSAAIRIQ